MAEAAANGELFTTDLLKRMISGVFGGTTSGSPSGGKGNDTFQFFESFPFASATIKDFHGGAGPSDAIEFSTDIFADFTAVMAHAAQVGVDVVITEDASNTITLQNVQLANLTADDFVFV